MKKKVINLEVINRIAVKIDIKPWSIKHNLGMPLVECPATTIEEAIQLVESYRTNCEERLSAALTLNRLIQVAINKATTSEELNALYEKALVSSPAKRSAYLKRNKLLMLEYKNAKTLEDYAKVLKFSFVGSRVAKLATKKIIELF